MIGFGVFIGIMLLVGSVYDWRYRSVPVWLLVMSGLGGLAGILWTLLCTDRGAAEVLSALLPGGMSLLLAYASREQIGYGDGVLLVAMGGCLEAPRVVTALVVALAGACVVSILLLVCRRAKRNSRIPFVPFLCMGCVVVVLGGMNG